MDPFDRMLAAQAKLEELPLASVDPALGLFGIDILRGVSEYTVIKADFSPGWC